MKSASETRDENDFQEMFNQSTHFWKQLQLGLPPKKPFSDVKWRTLCVILISTLVGVKMSKRSGTKKCSANLKPHQPLLVSEWPSMAI